MKYSYKGSKTAEGIKKNVTKKRASNMKTIRTHYFTTNSCICYECQCRAGLFLDKTLVRR